jgi:hypothetical protein
MALFGVDVLDDMVQRSFHPTATMPISTMPFAMAVIYF